jgi:hypothetical protein
MMTDVLIGGLKHQTLRYMDFEHDLGERTPCRKYPVIARTIIQIAIHMGLTVGGFFFVCGPCK